MGQIKNFYVFERELHGGAGSKIAVILSRVTGQPMKWILALLTLLAAPMAHAEPWLCTEPDGSRQFSYEPESAKKKNCVHQPIPSGNVWRARPRDFSDERHASFPRVPKEMQKQRDVARREILERELAEERRALAEAMRQLDEQKTLRGKDSNPVRADAGLKPIQERIRVHMSNIANLEKELRGSS